MQFQLFSRILSHLAPRQKRRIASASIFLAMLILSMQSFATPAQAVVPTIIYVDADAPGANNGTTWKNAYTDLQSALAAATATDEIWIAAGTYVPSTSLVSYTDSFQLVDGVEIYGGFAASETTRSQRDWENNITILSGDIGGDDITNSAGIVTDPNNVVGLNTRTIIESTSISSATILDGFTITAGGNSGTGSGSAGGLRTIASSPTIRNITFIGNKGGRGGAMTLMSSSNPLISNVVVQNNLALSHGGGIYIDSSSSPIILNATITANSANNQGGGIYSSNSDPALTNVVVRGNTSLNDGGGVFIGTGPNTVLHNMLISGNNTINNGSEGGGLHVFDSDIAISNLTIVGNFSPLGGGIANTYSILTVNNSIIWGNDDNNTAATASSYENFAASTTLRNSDIENITLVQSNSNFNNIDSDPLFVSPINSAAAPTISGNFQLTSNSPAIDTGNSSLYTSASNNDLAGNNRINGAAIDMGAYESNFIPLTLTVDGSGSGSVTASGINCPGDCTEAYAPNTMVTFTAAANTGSNFISWSGASGCSNNPVCTVTMDSAKNITATFNLKNYGLSTVASPSNGGTIVSAPTGINCPGDCSEIYQYGDVITLTATAALGFEFVGWGGAVTSSCPGLGTCAVTIDQAKLARADFAPIYTLTTNKSGAGSGTITSSSNSINCGTTCSTSAVDGTVIELTATAATGSIFTGWSGGGCTGTGTCSVVLDASKTVTANFEPLFDLTINKSGSGDGTVTSLPIGVNCGITCTISARSGTLMMLIATSDNSSDFTGWSGGGCSGTSNCIVTFDASKTVTANFVRQFELNVAKLGDGTGTVTSSPAGINCGTTCSMLINDGDSAILTATADNDSILVGWSINKCADDTSCRVSATQAQTVTATFAKVYDLTLVKNGDGGGRVVDTTNQIDCDPVCSFSAASGTVITLTAIADNGSIFTAWSKTACGNETECVITLDSSQTMTATFALSFDLIVAKAGDGSGSVSSSPTGIDCGITCTVSAASGTLITLTATADSGSIFDGWSGDGCSGIDLCVVPLTATKSVTATFIDSPTARDLTIIKTGEGSGTVTSSPAGIDCGPNCMMSVADGAVITLSAQAADGSMFAGWSGGGCNGTDNCTATLDESKSITAEFRLSHVSTGYVIFLPLTVKP